MLFSLYNPTGSGHYDAIILYIYTVNNSKASSKPQPKEHSSCRCGVNGNNSGKSCTPNQYYATRCKCYLSSTPCSSNCCYKNCNNHCGQRPVTSLEGKRKRRAHSLQIELPSSKKFAVERGAVLPVNRASATGIVRPWPYHFSSRILFWLDIVIITKTYAKRSSSMLYSSSGMRDSRDIIFAHDFILFLVVYLVLLLVLAGVSSRIVE